MGEAGNLLLHDRMLSTPQLSAPLPVTELVAPLEELGQRHGTWVVAALIGLTALIVGARLHTYNEPLERDLTTYAVIAHEMVNGKSLYSDLWDHKPPAIHVTYAAAELIAGYGRRSIFLMNVAASLATMIACYFAGSAGAGGRIGGLIAATLWAIASGDLAIEGNQPNTEVFLNAFLAAGFAVLVRAQKVLSWRNAAFAGVVFAGASLYKHVAIFEVVFLAAAYLIYASAGNRRLALGHVGLIGAIGAISWGAVVGYFQVTGRGNAFFDAVFAYNRSYSGDMLSNLGQVLTWPPVSSDVLAVTTLMGTLAIGGAALGIFGGARRQWSLLLAFALGAHVAVVMPGRFYPHYYQLWLPPLAIGAGWTIGLLKTVVPQKLSVIPHVVAASVVVVLLLLEIPYYMMPADRWSLQKYGDIFVNTDRLAAKIDNFIPKGASFYEWGNETGLYFTSGRRPPSGITFAYPMMRGLLAAKLSARLIEDLDQNKPDLMVLDRWTLNHTVPNHPVLHWIERNYQPLTESDGFVLCRRTSNSVAKGSTDTAH